MEIISQQIESTYSTIQVHTRGSGSPTILLLHGNSFNSTIFKHILSSNLAQTHKVIALDLPGHGGSSNAHPGFAEKAYTQQSYANAALQVLAKLEIHDVIVIGWSLGGHIAIELAAKSTVVKGVMLIGTPPVNTGEVPEAFSLASNSSPGAMPSWRAGYPARDDLSETEMQEYAHVCADPPYEEWMFEAVKRTDQKARRIMFEAFAGDQAVVLQRDVVESRRDVLWAVINGSQEPWINLDFIRRVRFATLWKGECVEMDGLLHAPFWAEPDAFQKLLDEFVEDCSSLMK